jgi:hypothetical protein
VTYARYDERAVSLVGSGEVLNQEDVARFLTMSHVVSVIVVVVLLLCIIFHCIVYIELTRNATAYKSAKRILSYLCWNTISTAAAASYGVAPQRLDQVPLNSQSQQPLPSDEEEQPSGLTDADRAAVTVSILQVE